MHSEGFGAVADDPWLVLGGGGLKGLAHVGAWQALREAGLAPRGIVGTSIGALVGALISSGMEPEEMRRLALDLEQLDIARVNRRVAWINGLRQTSVYRGDVLRAYIERLMPAGGWKALRVPLLVNAVDLADGSTEWFGTGARTDVSLGDAVYASAALPVLYPPLEAGGRVFVDGGAGHQLALRHAADQGAARIIGVDAGSGERGDPDTVLRQGLVAIHQRVFSIMTYRRRREQLAHWTGPPLLYVRPRLDGYTSFDFASVEYFLDEGYRAMREALATL